MNQYWERKKLKLFFGSSSDLEQQFTTEILPNSKHFQCLTSRPNWTNSHGHNNFWITPGKMFQASWIQGGPSSFFTESRLISSELTKSRCLLNWSPQSSPHRRLQDIRASTCELASVTIKLRSLEGQAGTHQSKLSVMPNYNLISIGLCRSVPSSLLPPPVLPRPPNSVKVQHNWEELWSLSDHGQNKSSKW